MFPQIIIINRKTMQFNPFKNQNTPLRIINVESDSDFPSFGLPQGSNPPAERVASQTSRPQESGLKTFGSMAYLTVLAGNQAERRKQEDFQETHSGPSNPFTSAAAQEARSFTPSNPFTAASFRPSSTPFNQSG